MRCGSWTPRGRKKSGASLAGDLFGAKDDELLYDLTSTDFACDVPADENDPRQIG